MKRESIDKLQQDLEKLITKHSQYVEKNDFGSALNVMKNIDCLTQQLKKIDFETKVSKFITVDDSGNSVQLISIWKQNSFGEIKDIETYYLGERYKENLDSFLETLSKNWDSISDELKNNIYKLFKK